LARLSRSKYQAQLNNNATASLNALTNGSHGKQRQGPLQTGSPLPVDGGKGRTSLGFGCLELPSPSLFGNKKLLFIFMEQRLVPPPYPCSSYSFLFWRTPGWSQGWNRRRHCPAVVALPLL